MLKTLNSNEIDTEKWQNLAKISPFSSFFQTRECYDFYCSLSFLEPFLFGVEENGELAGVVCGYIVADGGKIKQFFSRQAIVPSGALLADNISDEALSKLLQFTIKNIQKKTIYIEFRNYFDYSAIKNIFEDNHFYYQTHLNFHINTENYQTANQNLSSTKRRDIKISQTNGAEIIEITEKNDIKNYYELLKNLYSTKIKTPLFPFKFFEKIAEKPFCKIFGIKYNNEIIGGSVCVFANQNAVYEWFCCGLDGKFKNIFPSTLATWAGISFATENGFKYFDMMGAGKPKEDYGVRKFKEKFGGTLVEHGRFLCITKPLLYNFGKFAIKIMKKRK